MTGKKIFEARKFKGLSQEELSEISKVNVRTIQRIENGNNIPRGKTLTLLCDALDLDLNKILPTNEETIKNSVLETIISCIFLVGLNLLLMTVFGYLTLTSEATTNSKVAAFLLSVLIPFFIIEKTKATKPVVRLFKFGSGFIIYFVMVAYMHKFPLHLVTGFYPPLLIAISTLYYGDGLLSKSME